MRHAVDTGLSINSSLKGENHNVSKYTFEQVTNIRNLYKNRQYSMRKLAKEFNCSIGYISDIVNNKIRTDI